MTKRELEFLERCLGAEIDSAFTKAPALFQSKAKGLAQPLIDAGLVAYREVTIPGRPPVVVSGYSLTQKGHMTYCTSLKAPT